MSADQAEVDEHAATLADRAGGEKALASLLGQARMTRKQLLESLTYGVLREAVQDARYADVGVGEAKVRRFYDAESEGPVHEARGRYTWPPSSRATKGSPQMPSSAYARATPSTRSRGSSPSIRSSRTPAATWGGSRPPRSPRASARPWTVFASVSCREPVQGMGGWYVFKVLGRRAATVIPYAEVRDELRAELTRRQVAALERPGSRTPATRRRSAGRERRRAAALLYSSETCAGR